jgi:hypothetical protein
MKEILLDRQDDGVILLTLNRPDRRSAMLEGLSAQRERRVPRFGNS